MIPHSIRYLALLGLVVLGLCVAPVHGQPCQTPLLPLQPGMTVSTVSSALPGGVNPYVVYINDVRDPAANAPGLDTNWFADHDNNQSGTAWTNAILGEVFGICLDDQPNPNIYVAATTVYSTQGTGLGTSGAVYRINGTTGNVCVAVDLPNTGNAGLGNLCYDRQNQQFFVADLDDGMIYRFNGPELLCGTQVGQATVFDHGVDGRPDEGLSPIPDDPSQSRTQLGRRVFAVQKHPTENRLYYSVFWEVGSNTANPTEDNEIWSIELDAAGDFVLGTARREVILPSTGGGGQPVVTDIDFSPLTCDMALAERTMSGNFTSAHNSNVRVYTGNTGGWAPAACSVLRVGNYSVGNNAAGGIGHDCDGNLWATGDAIHFASGDRIYGMQRIDLADNCADATGSSNAYLVDYDCDIVQVDKTLLGDVDVYHPECNTSCGDPQDCMEVDPRIECSPNGDYSVTLNITNNSGVDAERIRLLPLGGFSFSPSTFIGTVPDTTTTTINTTLTGANPGDVICFEIWLLDANLEQCCVREICLEVPNCCLDFRLIDIECLSDGTFLVNFEVINLSAIPVDRIFLWPLPPGAFTFSPDNFLFGTPLLMGQSSGPLSTVITGANPGDVICFDVTIHDSNTGDCCGEKITLELPDCDPCDQPALCDLPPRVSLCPTLNGLVASFPATICNPCNQGEVPYEVSFEGIPGCGDVPFDPSFFIPSGFGTPPLPPGECIDRLIQVSIPVGLLERGQCICFRMVVTNSITGESISCESRLCLPQLPIKVIGPVDPIDINFPEPGIINVEIQSIGEAVAFDYEFRLYIPGEAPGPQAMSLNGLLPGAPAFGSVDIPAGGSTSLQTTMRVTDHEPFVFYDIILMVYNPNGDLEPVAAYPVRSVDFRDCDGDGVSDDIAIAVGLVNDNNNNGVPDSCEGLPLFASYLRGDSNQDGSFDIADPVYLMSYMYGGGTAPLCMAAADFDGDASLKMVDALSMLQTITGSAPAPGLPFPTCGQGSISSLSCVDSSCP